MSTPCMNTSLALCLPWSSACARHEAAPHDSLERSMDLSNVLVPSKLTAERFNVRVRHPRCVAFHNLNTRSKQQQL